MSSSTSLPVEIRRLGVQTVRIRWRDGHVSEYENLFLRDHCPCAECRERPRYRLPVVGSPKSQLFAQSISPVGRYAVSIQWSDGHDGGIYSYQTLRSLCRCAECTGVSPERHP